MIGLQVPQRDPADARDNVQVDDAPVGVPRARPQGYLLGRQPPLGQVDGHGEAAAFVGAVAATVIGKIRRQGLGGSVRPERTAGAECADPSAIEFLGTTIGELGWWWGRIDAALVEPS